MSKYYPTEHQEAWTELRERLCDLLKGSETVLDHLDHTMGTIHEEHSREMADEMADELEELRELMLEEAAKKQKSR